MIPTFLIVHDLGLVNSLGALILPNLVTPFGIFLLRQFFRTLPIELEEAARIDGCSRLGVLCRVVLPLSMPALATLGIVTFLWTWNDFLWPLIVITSTDHSTVQLGLASFQGAQTKDALMAGNVMALAPMLLVFIFAQRWLCVARLQVSRDGASGSRRVRSVTKVFGDDTRAVDALGLELADGG
jgi:multiple sugar transport system permease protein